MATKERKGSQKGRQKTRTVRRSGLREPFRQNSKGHPVAEKPRFLRPLRSFAAILPGGLVSSIMFTAVASPSQLTQPEAQRRSVNPLSSGRDSPEDRSTSSVGHPGALLELKTNAW